MTTRQEKFDAIFEAWASQPIQFASPEAEAKYKERVQIWKDVIQLKKPVRVPFLMTSGIHPFLHAGITTEEGMYDYEKMSAAFKKYNDDV